MELFISGIGGQGVQLAGKVLALAAVAEGRHVMLSGDYGGHMRGGSSVGTVVIGPRPLRALPVLPSAGSAIAMHDQYWENVGGRLRPGSLILADAAIAPALPGMDGHRLVQLPATDIATGMGARMAAGMVLLGAYAAMTGIVAVDSLVAAMKEQIPVYRSQHIAANERAIRAGADALPALGAPFALDDAPLREAV